MKLNIATVGLVLLGFAVAAPEANAEPDVDVRGFPSCSSCHDMYTCGRTHGCYWQPRYECIDKKHAPGGGKRCSAPSRVDSWEQCRKHKWCDWVCRDPHKGECKRGKHH